MISWAHCRRFTATQNISLKPLRDGTLPFLQLLTTTVTNPKNTALVLSFNRASANRSTTSGRRGLDNTTALACLYSVGVRRGRAAMSSPQMVWSKRVHEVDGLVAGGHHKQALQEA